MGADSDDDVQVAQRTTKTAAKKADRKVAVPKDDTDALLAATTTKATAGNQEGFAQVQQGRQPKAAQRGGADARGGRGERGGYGGRGRGGQAGRGRGGAGPRPRTAYKQDAEGNVVVDPARKERKPFAGKAREEGHPYDRKDGTGKGRRGDKKDGHGKGNWGKEGGVYKQKGEETAEKPAEKEEAVVEEEKKQPEPEYREEILGYSLDDFLAGKQTTSKKEGRAADKLTQKVEARGGEKEKQSTVLQNQYLKGAVAKTAHANGSLLGVQADEQESSAPPRGGNRRGDGGAQRGGRKQNARQALKKTEDDFPAL